MLIHNENFNIKQIAESGQCFRMTRLNESSYRLIAYGQSLDITQIDETSVDLDCSTDQYESIWKDYFDLEYDYASIVSHILNGNDPFLRDAAVYGSGIRILKQEPFEAMISFIISQNKNIPAIKSCIEAICKRYGEEKINAESDVVYHTFPTAESLSLAKSEDLLCLKTGYRDQYIISASKAVAEGTLNLSQLITSNSISAFQALKSIHGVGDKVANCVLLYGLHHIEVFPIDVWIKRVIDDIYQGHFDTTEYEGYAGIIQQYIFYYIRHLYENKHA